MKIVLLATVYEIGGLSNVIRNIMDNLDRERFDVVFIVENLAKRHYPLRKDIKFINLDVRPAHGALAKSVNMLRHLRRIRKTIVAESPDAVIGFGFAVNCLYLLSFLWPARLRHKAILGEYTEELFIRQKARSFRYRVFRIIYRAIMYFMYFRADAIVCVSRSLSRRVSGFFLMDERKIKVIHVPVDTKLVRMQAQEKAGRLGGNGRLPCVGTISRLSFEKGVDYLIRGFSYLVKDMDARLVIVGDGAQRDDLEKMATDLGIEDKVDFLGWLENPYSYLSGMDVFVLPSLWEGFPTVIVESMACGVPVLATRSVGGVQELIRDGVDGMLVPIKDAAALSESMRRLLADSGLRKRLAEEAGKKVESFDSRSIAGQYESLIMNL